jgi:hypothetical protein
MNQFSDPSPYQSPQFVYEQQYLPVRTPGVWTWYIVYCVAMALLYLMVLAIGALMLTFSAEIADDEMNPEQAVIMGGMFTVLGGVLMLMFAVAPFLPKTKAAWIYGFVTIGIGLTSACTLPICIPLLIFWLKPETKMFFKC